MTAAERIMKNKEFRKKKTAKQLKELKSFVESGKEKPLNGSRNKNGSR